MGHIELPIGKTKSPPTKKFYLPHQYSFNLHRYDLIPCLPSSISTLGKSLKMSKSIFLQGLSKSIKNHHILYYFLSWDHFFLRLWPWNLLLIHAWGSKSFPHQLPIIIWEARKHIQKERGWDAKHLIHDASIDSYVNKAFLQPQYIMTWENVRLTLHTIYCIYCTWQ